MKIKEIGEFGLIRRIAKKIKVDKTVAKGIGDDAAVIKTRDKYLLLASDMLIEGVHFNKRRCRPFQIGWKALGVNISDIAAMGGQPRYAVVSVGLPGYIGTGFVEGVYSGIRSMADRFGVNIVGGDTVASKRVVINVAVLGEAEKSKAVFRSGARPGDIVFVTGALGGSMKGKHLTFIPRLAESRFLVSNFKINSMIDLSDGLSSDLARICEESRCGADIYESLIPVSRAARSLENALRDGEDFELLFTVPRKACLRIRRAFGRRFKTPLTAIGEIRRSAGGIRLIDRRGKAAALKAGGFSHF